MCNLIILTNSELQLVLTVILILVLWGVLKGIRWLIRKTSIPVHTVDAKPDPEPEDRPYPRRYPSFFNADTGTLPYVYHPQPVTQKLRRIKYTSPYLGIEQEVVYHPRNKAGKAFDHVRGIAVSPTLTLLREIIVESDFPGDIRTYIKHFNGRLPNENEIKQIYAKRAMICNNLLECGEPLLQERRYLYTCGNLKKDRDYNYCLDFSTGEITIADCDSYVAAILVE